jgi:hypothetical protein
VIPGGNCKICFHREYVEYVFGRPTSPIGAPNTRLRNEETTIPMSDSCTQTSGLSGCKGVSGKSGPVLQELRDLRRNQERKGRYG